MAEILKNRIQFAVEGEDKVVAAQKKIAKSAIESAGKLEKLNKSVKKLRTENKFLHKEIKRLTHQVKLYEGAIADLKPRIERTTKAQVGYTKSVKSASLATKKHAKANKVLSKEQNITYRNNRNLLGSFSVIRSKMLLATFALGMLSRTLGKYVAAAGDAEETTNKFNVVFGDSAEASRIFAETLGNSVGRATSSLMAMMASLQDTFVPLGFAREDAAELSKGLTQLSLDVASFQNAADEEVMRAFQSAIVGNHEAVRSFGIILTEATIKEEAMSLGLTDTNRELSSQEKILARVSLLNKGSKDAVGDLINTYDSYQNSVKRLTNSQKELIENLGTVLMPIARDVVALFAKLIEIFSDEARIRGYATALVLVADALLLYKIATMGAIVVTQGLKRAIATTGLGLLVVGLGELLTRTVFTTEATEEFDQKAADLKNTIDGLKNSIAGASEEMKELEESTKSTFMELGDASPIIQYQIDAVKSIAVSWQLLSDAQKTYYFEGLGMSEDEFNARLEFRAKVNQLNMTAFEEQVAMLDQELAVFRAYGISETELEQYKQDRLKDIREKSAEHSIDLADAMRKALETAFDPDVGAGEAFKGFIIQVLQMLQQAILATEALSTALTFAWVPGMGMATAAASLVALEGAKAAVRGIKFAEFGMNEIVTQPTLIVAGEAGAERVNITPLSGSSGGQGAQGATINLNISGGIVQDDYIRNELIPALNKATGTGTKLNA